MDLSFKRGDLGTTDRERMEIDPLSGKKG